METVMLLNEFFGRAIDGSSNNLKDKDRRTNNDDDLFWYIIDNDKIHKDYLMPLAKKIKQRHKKGRDDRERCVFEFMPMVKKGCLEFYHHKKMQGKPGKLFPQELRDDLCQKLYDHFYDNIIKDCYMIGESKNKRTKENSNHGPDALINKTGTGSGSYTSMPHVTQEDEEVTEKLAPKSSFAGTGKPWNYKLGSAAHLTGKKKRPAKAGDLVGSSE